MVAMDQEVPSAPRIPGAAVLQLRINLIEEEIYELLTVLYTLRNRSVRGAEPMSEEKKVQSMTELGDAISDSIYVIVGTGVAFGLPGEAIFDIVHRANMTKSGGPVREDGKREKPPGWQPPEPAIHRLITDARVNYSPVVDPNISGVEWEGPTGSGV